MYIPEFNRIEDRDTSLAFLRAHPFAVLISSVDGLPFASHVPLAVTERSGQIVLRGHVAKANPHWKSFQQEQESLVIFQGPHAYISPALYEIRESVPTWNYAAVHVYGRVTLVDEKQAREILEALIAEFDSSYATQWASLSEEYRSRMYALLELYARPWKADEPVICLDKEPTHYTYVISRRWKRRDSPRRSG